LDDETFKIFAEKPAAVELPNIEPLEKAEATLTNTNQPPSIEPIAKQTEATAVPCAPAESLPEPVAELGGIIENKFLIDLNRCTVEDLQTIQGVGPALAKRIIEFRDARGQFTSIEELRQIPGIGRKTFRALAGIEPHALNRLLGVEHDRELSLQEIVRLTSALPGVDGCMLAMSDGLFLTGELPPHLDRNAVSVFAPQLFKKIGRYMRELRVGQIRRFTIFTDQQPISIFRAGDVYLIVIHDTRHFSKALLRRCERISQEIAHLCRQRAVV
jgi:competence ComEA-like helix-hairpin-helix protein